MEQIKLTAGEFKLAENQDGTRNTKFKMKARTTSPVMEYNIYHNFAGMNMAEKIGIDREHDPSRLVGFADGAEVLDATLYLAGEFVSTKADDDADTIVKGIKGGIPYQASIHTSFDGSDLIWYEDGQGFDVNGVQCVGPAVVVDKFDLIACACCARGADSKTKTELMLSDDLAQEFASRFNKDSVKQETIMSKEQKEEVEKIASETETVVELTEEATPIEEVAEEVIEEIVEELTEKEGEVEEIEEVVEEAVEELNVVAQLTAVIINLKEQIAIMDSKLTEAIDKKQFTGGTPTLFVEETSEKKNKTIFKPGPYSK